MPYYLSRVIIVSVFCFSKIGFTLEALFWAIFIFSMMVFYLHSGWFSVDLSKPFFPLKRDQFALEIQRKALINAVYVSILFNLMLSLFPWVTTYFPFLDINILALAVITYFTSQIFHFLLPQFNLACNKNNLRKL